MSRTKENFNIQQVKQILPEFFQDDYPKFVRFLELYMEFLETGYELTDEERKNNPDIHDFRPLNNNIKSLKDVGSIDENFLESMLSEIGNNFPVVKREVAKFLPHFFRYKGTKASAKLFFRMLFDEDVEVVYPKRNLFVVGKSRLGHNDQKVLQDGRLNQPLSILIKSGKSISEWEPLYKLFVHPAGFYIGGEIQVNSEVDLMLKFMPEPVETETGGDRTFTDSVQFSPMASQAKITGVIDGKLTDLERKIEDNPLTIDQLSDQYDSIERLDSPDRAMTSDESELDMSNDYETMDGAVEGSIADRDSP